MQSELNIGLLGHVDHGKTSVTEALTGQWTDVHSMEIKRGITIKLGYADTIIKKCKDCAAPQCYTTDDKCKQCKKPAISIRRVSFVDAPGHETLMATVIAASSILDGAILIIAANEKVPQPQTKEHKMVLETLGVKNIVVVQNKIDLVTPDKATENYKQIKEFLKGSIYEKAPIIPISANYKSNIDSLLEAIEKYIPTPKRKETDDPIMYIARSFDVNKPGTPIRRLIGGIIGGSLIQGRFQIGDEIEIRPGVMLDPKDPKSKLKPIRTTIIGLNVGKEKIEEVGPGGLIGLATSLDPALTKADGLIGNIVGYPGKMPPVLTELDLSYILYDRVDFQNPKVKDGEHLVISIGTATTLGLVSKAKKKEMKIILKRPVCALKGSKVAISRRIGQRWRLSGQGQLK